MYLGLVYDNRNAGARAAHQGAMTPPNDRPPGLPSSMIKNRYQPERMSANRYIIPARRYDGNSGSGKSVGKTGNPQFWVILTMVIGFTERDPI